MAQDGQAPRYHERALLRGLNILCAFSLTRPELTLTELQDIVKVHKASLLRLLNCLVYAGFVDQDPATKKYRLGVKTLHVGTVYQQSLRIHKIAEPIMRRLADEYHQTADLAVLEDSRVVHLAITTPARPMHFYVPVGSRDPVHTTALGKVLLSALDDEAIRHILNAAGMTALTPHSLTSPDRFLECMDTVRRLGYALDNEETHPGICCVAAGVRTHSGHCVAAVSLTGHASEFAEPHIDTYVGGVTAAAHEISLRLGYLPDV